MESLEEISNYVGKVVDSLQEGSLGLDDQDLESPDQA